MRSLVVVTHSWFPSYHSMLDRLQEDLNIPIEYVVLSSTDRNRAWAINRKAKIIPRVLPWRRLTLGSHDIVVNVNVRKHLENITPAVVVTEGWGDPGFLAVHGYAKSRSAPIITWMCGRDPRTNSSFPGRVLRATSNVVARRAIRESRLVFVYGTHAEKDAIALGAKEGNVVIVKQTIDEDHFDYRRWQLSAAQKVEFRRHVGFDERPLFLCVSQLIPRKGIGDLLTAFQDLRHRGVEVQVLLIGRGNMDGIVRAFIQPRRDGFVWLPAVNYDEIPRFYAMADCSVFPTHFDAWGVVVNESHCARLPIICSDGAQAAEDLVRHGETGLVYHAGDVETLMGHMEFAVRHPDKMKEMAEKGYQLVQTEWNQRITVRIWKEHLERVIGGR